jgi:aspartokinase
MEQPIISGIAFNRDEAKLTVLGVPDRPGIAYQILGPIGEANIDVDMIIQNVGHDGTTDFLLHRQSRRFRPRQEDAGRADQAAHRRPRHRGRQQDLQGLGGRRRHALHPGVASKMFRTLAEEGINIQMISTSEIKISVVVDEKYLELAVRCAQGCTARLRLLIRSGQRLQKIPSASPAASVAPSSGSATGRRRHPVAMRSICRAAFRPSLPALISVA